MLGLRGRADLRRQRLRVLVPSDGYHVQSEVVRALTALGHEALSVDIRPPATGPTAPTYALSRVLQAIGRHRPDLLVSINYVGFDRAGWLDEVLATLELPCAIWFVDSPLFFAMGYLHQHAPRTELFAWDRTHAARLTALSGRPAQHLPLACEPERFAAARALPADQALPTTFVGSSLVPLSAKWRGRLSDPEAATGEQMAERLLADRQSLHGLVPSPGPPIDRTVMMAAYANCVASRAHRRALLAALPSAELAIFGDAAWKEELPHVPCFDEVSYGHSLGTLYRRSTVNLNATILQMPSAVNQRVFDVPAAGGFVLTDAQSEVFELFERDTEVITYRTAGELERLRAYFAARPKERQHIAQRAHRRITQQHTYGHRVDRLLTHMRA